MSDTTLGEELTSHSRAASERQTMATAGYRWLIKQISHIPRDSGQFITEAEVVEGAKIGRTPAREALQRLELEGHLRIIPRKGIYIAPISDAEMEHLIEARRAIERWASARVATAELMGQSDLAQILGDQELSLADNEKFIELDRIFHEKIVTAAGNPILTSFYEQLRDRQLRMGVTAVSRKTGRSLAVLNEHRAIEAGIRSGNVAAALAAVDAHLDSTFRALLGR